MKEQFDITIKRRNANSSGSDGRGFELLRIHNINHKMIMEGSNEKAYIFH